MKERLTFKNQPQLTGLAAVAAGTPAIDIRLNGEDVGVIRFNDHMSIVDRNLGIQIAFQCKVADTNNWKWRTIGHFTDSGKWENARFDSGDAAKAWVRKNIEKMAGKLYRKGAIEKTAFEDKAEAKRFVADAKKEGAA